jgi:glutamate-1-semialdehyde aminotransferase
MVRFARSGGEANSIAIRIARAASGKDKWQSGLSRMA